jgi:hypothetical protein
MPTSWPEDLSTLTSEELAVLHRANEEWFTDLKLRVQLLTDGKTVGVIGEDNFARSMKSINKDIAECVRRRQLLDAVVNIVPVMGSGLR